MKKILSLTIIFIVSITIGKLYRSNSLESFFKTENETDGEFEEHEDGPEQFIKFHRGIRTRSDQTKPGYSANYQINELKKAQRNAAIKKATARTMSNGVIGFTERGPGNVPGRTRGLLVDPDDGTHKTWFAGSASGGIWKTIDAGTSWLWLTPNIPNMATTSLAMADSNHDIIYAGTGEGFGQDDGVSGSGILKSIDHGDTWDHLPNSTQLGSVNRIAVDPLDPNGNIIVAAANDGIYKSTDGGNSWAKVFDGWVQDIKPTPGNFSIQYAGLNGIGVLKSTDAGSTWKFSNAGMLPNGRVEIAISPVQTDRLVASCEGSLSGKNSDLYVSDDGAKTWYLVTLTLASKTLDYLASSAGNQGWYDNTTAFSPYNKDVVYIGGIGTYQVTLGSAGTTSSGAYSMYENNTGSFLTLVNFNASAYGGKLEVGTSVTHDSIEVRFGPGQSQKAHMFWVPGGATSGVPDINYSYIKYVDVPFEVWDIKNNQQLMVSFRDQGRDSTFNLIPQNTSATDATQQSREYVFIHNVPYNSITPSSSITVSGGQKFNEEYFFWPVLKADATWDPAGLPISALQMFYASVNKYSSTVKSVADVYSEYDGVNNSTFVHPDQHNILPIKQNDASQTFNLLMSNDGGVFLSATSTSPGTTQGEWKKVGNGYNTSQFYGADKKPGAQEYFGGMQDNSTYFTPKGTISSAGTSFLTNSQLAGDGFEVLWNSLDPNKMIGGAQYNYFSRSINGGNSWTTAFSGFPTASGIPDATKFPFISKLANSKQAPDLIYSVGSQGVWRSINFGTNWVLSPISQNWAANTNITFADVEVSRANANIVWAGAGQYSQSNLFVSTNAGKTFTSAVNPNGFILGNITRIATHPTDQNTAYALYSFAQTSKVLMTTDLGQTWTDISGFGSNSSSSNGFPDVATYCLYVRPDNPNIIWAGTEIGIVESLDGGTSWTMLTSFPSVPVWDMKGQDNEIVIATHGRGIWTATLAEDQNGNFIPSQLIAAGTAPKSSFKLKVKVPLKYDSVQIQMSGKTFAFNPPDTGTYVVTIANAPKGALNIQLISYKGSAPVYSALGTGANLSLKGTQTQFFDYLTQATNFYLDGMTLQQFGNSNYSLQSNHNYLTNQTSSATLLVPIIISSGTNTSLVYNDVAIVQPGSNGSVFGQDAFNDYVVVEGTKDGLTWIPIGNGYNSSANSNWLATYDAKQAGDPSLSVTENFNLKNKFNSGDTILVRFRITANSDNTTGWGWSIDNIFIQLSPTAVEPQAENTVMVYPNPSKGKINLNYSLEKPSEVSIAVWDMTGRNIHSENLGTQSDGAHQTEVNLESATDGIYLLRVQTKETEKTIRVLIKK